MLLESIIGAINGRKKKIEELSPEREYVTLEEKSQQEENKEDIKNLRKSIIQDLDKSKKRGLMVTEEDEEKIKERIKKMDNDEFLSMISMAFANVNNNLSVLNILIGIAEGGETDDIRKAKQIVKRNVKKINRWFKTDLKVV